MARPLEYPAGSRHHMGTKFNKEVIELFHDLCRKYGYTRTQALEFLVMNAIVAQHIPPKNMGIDSLIMERQRLLGSDKTVPTLSTIMKRPRLGVPTTSTNKSPVKQRHTQKAV